MYNTIVIGAGPAGMATALYLYRSGLNVLIIEKDLPGGQLLKTDNIENYLGFEKIAGADLALKMYKQIKNSGIKIIFEEVEELKKQTNFIVKTKNNKYESKNVVIATGKINNKLGLENENIKGVSYCAVCDGAFYKNKTVAVVGGGNSAFSQALYLSSIAKKVYLINRTEKIKAEKRLQDNVKNNKNIIYLKNKIIKKINGNKNIKSITLNNNDVIELDGLFLAIGGTPKIDFITEIKLDKKYIIVNDKMETNINGIFACGDVIKKDYYQIATAISDGIKAALNIKERE